MSRSEGQRGDVRASDHEREVLVGDLRRHCADGRLTVDELEVRASAAYAARTVAELDVLVGDLPLTDAPLPPGAAPERVRAVLGDVERAGRWRAPERLRAVAVLGNCRIDLRRADLPAAGLTIEALAVAGDVRILVPEDARVEMTGSAFLGSKRVRGDHGTLPTSGAPTATRSAGGAAIHVHATAVCGNVFVDVTTLGERLRSLAGSAGLALQSRSSQLPRADDPS